jgi:heme/copper-type cytochrome/quinol oxidase subunit 2
VPRLTVLVLCGCLAGLASAQDVTEVTASKQGYRPATIRVRKGETVRMRLKTADDEHCFAVDALRLEKRIQPGKITAFELTPDRAGTFPVYCCLEPDNETLRGRLIVAE